MSSRLTVFSRFGLFNGVPQNRTLLKMRRSIIGQQDFLMYDFTLSAVIVSNSVILIFYFFTRNVCSLCYRACAFSSAYDFDVKMINGYMNISFYNSVYIFFKIYNRLKIGLKQALFFCNLFVSSQVRIFFSSFSQNLIKN